LFIPPPPPPEIFASTRWIRRCKKTVQYSVGRVNIQQGQYSTSRSHQKLRINVSAKLLKNDPGYIFNDSRSQFSTEKNDPRFNIQRWKMTPGSVFNPVQNTSLHRRVQSISTNDSNMHTRIFNDIVLPYL
jgi:hypothetical protein